MVSADDSFFFNFFHERIVYYCPTVIAVSGASLLLMCCAHANTAMTRRGDEHMLQAIFDAFQGHPTRDFFGETSPQTFVRRGVINSFCSRKDRYVVQGVK